MRLSTFKGAKMRFLKEIFIGVLLLSDLTGRGTFHIHGSYDLDEDGKVETLVLNTRTSSAIWVEITTSMTIDTLWSFTLPNGGKFSDVEIVDINDDGYNEIIATPDLFASIGDQAWLYVFPGTATGFLNKPLICTDSPLELTTIRPSNLALVPGESPQLAVAFGAPVRFGMIFDLDISDGTVSLINSQRLSAPIINNGHGVVYIGGFTSGGGHYMAIVSPEENRLKTAIFDIGQNFNLIHSDLMILDEARYLLGSDIQPYRSKQSNKNGLLIPFGSDDVFLLSLTEENANLSNTSLSGQGAFPMADDGDLATILQNRLDIDIYEAQPFISDYLPSRIEKGSLRPPTPPLSGETATLNSIPMNYDKDVTSIPDGQIEDYGIKDSGSGEKKDYRFLSPTLGDFLASVKDETKESKTEKEIIAVPKINADMKSVNWADEAGFTQLNLGEYIPEPTDTISAVSPIPVKDTGITTFTTDAQEALIPNIVDKDTAFDIQSRNEIDLYYVLAMTPASDTRDRYVFDGEAPFGVAVNQVPPMGEATHFQHGISANLLNLNRGETYDFAYSLRDARLDSITTLTMVHDMQTNVVFMSISPTDDSLSQSYQPESFDPKLFEFPDYFFEGFPTSLNMDFTEKLIRFSFHGEEDSTYHGIYLSSTTPSNPSQSLAVFMDEGTLQAVRGEVVVRANGSKKVTTEFDLVGKVEPAVMFSRLIQELFPEELKIKLLQGASLEEPLFGPRGKLPKITREPRLPEAQPDQTEPEIPVEPKQSNVPEKNDKTVEIKSDPPLETPETQESELTPSVPNVEKKEHELPSPSDSLQLEKAKEPVKPSEESTPSAPEEAQPEPDIEESDTEKISRKK